jgi:hypothetical protein
MRMCVCVLKVSPNVKLIKDGQMKIRYISLIDNVKQTPVKVALFAQDAEEPPQLQDIVRISEVYPYTWKKRTGAGLVDLTDKPTSLGTKPQSKIEVYFIKYT